MPSLSHRNHPLLLLNSICIGKVTPVDTTIARSLRPSCHVFSVNKLQILTLMG